MAGVVKDPNLEAFMIRSIRACLVIAVFASPSLALAQTPAPSPTPPRQNTAGYTVSEKLLKTIMKRYAYELSDSVELDAAQEDAVLEKLNARWVPFLQANQDKVAPLVERYLQAMVDPDPPSPEDVKSWSEAALELNEKFLEQIDASDKEIGALMRPEQLGRFRAESAKMRMGLGMFNGQLRQWSTGNYDTGMWDRQRDRRQAKRERHRKQWEQKAAKTPELKPFNPTAWEAYVIDFVARFGLDSAQTISANAILDDVQTRAHDYIRQRTRELERVRGEIVAAQKPTERQKLIEKQQTLLGPLEKLFNELNDRLAQIPTEDQWRQAEDKPQDNAHTQPAEDG
jgi:hypothetical protein